MRPPFGGRRRAGGKRKKGQTKRTLGLALPEDGYFLP
jgi:hypothetical protein